MQIILIRNNTKHLKWNVKPLHSKALALITSICDERSYHRQASLEFKHEMNTKSRQDTFDVSRH